MSNGELAITLAQNIALGGIAVIIGAILSYFIVILFRDYIHDLAVTVFVAALLTVSGLPPADIFRIASFVASVHGLARISIWYLKKIDKKCAEDEFTDITL